MKIEAYGIGYWNAKGKPIYMVKFADEHYNIITEKVYKVLRIKKPCTKLHTL